MNQNDRLLLIKNAVDKVQNNEEPEALNLDEVQYEADTQSENEQESNGHTLY